MRQVIKGTNVVVLVGSWNIAIFTPEWVKENLLLDKEFKVFFPSMVGCSLKFQTDLLAFCIEGNRLQFEIINSDKLQDAYVEIIGLLRIILRKLAHTPLNAMGTNYVFDFDAPFDELSTIQENGPLQKIVNMLETGVKSQALVRTFDLGDKKELNLRLESVQDGVNRIDFNFNYNIKNVIEVMNLLGDDDQLLIMNQALARKIIDDVYGA